MPNYSKFSRRASTRGRGHARRRVKSASASRRRTHRSRRHLQSGG